MAEPTASSVVQPFMSPRVFGKSFNLSAFIACIGLLLSMLVFFLAKQEVDVFLAQQLGQPVKEAVARLQRQVDDDNGLIGSLAGLIAVDPDLQRDKMRAFIKFANLERSAIEHIYLAEVDTHDVHMHEEILDRSPLGMAPFVPTDLNGLQELAHYTSDTLRATSAVLSDRRNAASRWLVLARPLRGEPGKANVVLGFSPVPRLFRELEELSNDGTVIHMTAGEFGDAARPSPFLVLDHAPSVLDSFMALPETEIKIAVDARTWRIAFRCSLRGNVFLIAALPYIEMCIGILLTLALILYLRVTRQRSTEVANLADSLRRANEQLSHKVAYEERMARALRESEQRFRAIFENASIGICQIAPSGEWLNANRTMSHILGYETPQALLADQPDFHGRLFVDSRQRQEWLAKLESGSQREYEMELFTLDRRAIWVNMSGHVVHNETGGRAYFECSMYDVTERRQSELALVQAKEQADFANRSKSEFLANMSHELRTPLNAIIGFAEIIKEQMFGAVGQPQYVEYARDIYDSGDLLLSLINDILDMSKIEAGKRALVETTLDIERVIQSVVRLVASRAKIGKLHLNVRVPKDLPGLRGEEKALKQIFTNLLTNAIKFTPEGGHVTLHAKMDEFGRMCIQVEDTGIGVAPEDIPLALAPFGQIESAMSRKNQGTGLGLPLTKALVELHGGVLDLQSRVAIGTTVTAIFPAERVVKKMAAV